MSREIKFRVWNVETGKWLRDYVGINNHGVIINDRGNAEDLSLCEEAIIEQFTGLKDKNGADIYENDVVAQLGDRAQNGRLFIVGQIGAHIPLTCCNDNGEPWKMPEALGNAARLQAWTGTSEPFYEVVGNIHENPDLLK